MNNNCEKTMMNETLWEQFLHTSTCISPQDFCPSVGLRYVDRKSDIESSMLMRRYGNVLQVFVLNTTLIHHHETTCPYVFKYMVADTTSLFCAVASAFVDLKWFTRDELTDIFVMEYNNDEFENDKSVMYYFCDVINDLLDGHRCLYEF